MPPTVFRSVVRLLELAFPSLLAKIKLEIEEKPRKIRINTDRVDTVFEKVITNTLYTGIYGCGIKKDEEGFTVTEGKQPDYARRLPSSCLGSWVEDTKCGDTIVSV